MYSLECIAFQVQILFSFACGASPTPHLDGKFNFKYIFFCRNAALRNQTDHFASHTSNAVPRIQT
jgi:hypothetical protein